jgi:hypothetical protein
LTRPQSRAFHLLYKCVVNGFEIRFCDYGVLWDQQAHEVLVLFKDAEIAVISCTYYLRLCVGHILLVIFVGSEGVGAGFNYWGSVLILVVGLSES